MLKYFLIKCEKNTGNISRNNAGLKNEVKRHEKTY